MMKKVLQNIGMAVCRLPRRGHHNVVKVLCLALGLSLGAVLISPFPFIGCTLVLQMLVVVIGNSYKVANNNPANYLKNE